MDVGQVKGAKGTGRKGKGKEKGKGEKDNGEAKGNPWTDDSYFVGECGTVASGDTRRPSAGIGRKTKEENPLAATVQAIATVSQIQSYSSDDDSFWIFTASALSRRDARILVDSGPDEHVCPTDFAPATPLGPTKGGTLCDAQGHMIEAHGSRTVYIRRSEFRVTNVKSPILSMEKLVKQGYRCEAGLTLYKLSTRTLDGEEFSLGVRQSLHDGWRSSQDLFDQW